ncbi:carbon-nitrogen hydrolase family protein [Acidocella sp.]|jgi:predicted amidohydrolase|uniref:carbon-nitrogen hydrolase family protein n=1 Tax=Acidocella sp. TaxID=50710 RepID=UPI002F427D13
MKPVKLAMAPFGVSPPPHFDAFVTRIDRLAAQSALAGADLLALPEYFSMVLAGAHIKAPDIAAELADVVDQAEALVRALVTIASRHKIYLLGGTVPMRVGAEIHNRAPLIGPSGQLEFQDKQAMTRFEAERWGVSGGAVPKVFETPFGRIGVSICYDAEFPLHVRAQVKAGAQLILVPSCTDSLAGFNRVRLCARARAIENQCFTAVIPLVGNAAWSGAIDENRGHAALFTPCDLGFPPDGVQAAGEMDEAELLFTSVDFSAIDRVRTEGGVLNHRDWHADISAAPVVKLA